MTFCATTRSRITIFTEARVTLDIVLETCLQLKELVKGFDLETPAQLNQFIVDVPEFKSDIWVVKSLLCPPDVEFTLDLVNIIGEGFEEALFIMFIILEKSVQIQATDVVVRIKVINLERHLFKRVPSVVHEVLNFIYESFVVKTVAPVEVPDDDPGHVSFVAPRQISLQLAFIQSGRC